MARPSLDEQVTMPFDRVLDGNRLVRLAPWELAKTGARPDASLGRQNYWETLQLTANLTRPRRVPETKP